MTMRTIEVPETALYKALGAMAAAIEEPWCVLGVRELQALVEAHGALERALGCKPDYVLRDGWVCPASARDRAAVIKRGVNSKRMLSLMQWSGRCTRLSIRRALAKLGALPWRGPERRDTLGRFLRAEK